MFYKNPLAYISANIDTENHLVMVEQVNNYKYPAENFIQEIKKKREILEELEIFCILGKKEEIEKIQEEVSDKISKFFEEIQEDNIEDLIENLQKEVDNVENSIIQRFFDLYISTIIENDKLKYPRMRKMENSNGISCLGFYLTNSPAEEKEKEVDSSMLAYLQKEKPFFMGKQIMLQSFLLEDIKDRKILAVLPNVDGEWYALLEGGIKLYLSSENPYQREKMTSEDVGRWTVLELESILNDPCYTYKKMFEPYGLFEEWNKVFLYALATLPIQYEAKTLELLYSDFLKFMEENICYVEEVEKAIIPKETFIEAIIIHIQNMREYLKGKEERGVSKNTLILLKSRYSYLPIMYKIIEKYYPEQVSQRLNYTKFSNAKWNELLEKMEKEQDNYNKGISLEDVANYYIDCIEGLQVTDRRVKTENEEMDLVCCNLSNNSNLWKLGPVILIECKNWTNKIDTKIIRNLSYIMDKKGVSTLLLFVKNDITNGAKIEIAKQAAHNKFIIPFNLQDLYEVDNEQIRPIDLLTLKLEGLEEGISDSMDNLM